jgi:hypothetical protein
MPADAACDFYAPIVAIIALRAPRHSSAIAHSRLSGVLPAMAW